MMTLIRRVTKFATRIVTGIISRNLAYSLKRYSVFIGIGGWVVMIVSGQVIVAAGVKLITESLRIPYYLHTDAKDMFGLASFFICTSIVALTLALV